MSRRKSLLLIGDSIFDQDGLYLKRMIKGNFTFGQRYLRPRRNSDKVLAYLEKKAKEKKKFDILLVTIVSVPPRNPICGPRTADSTLGAGTEEQCRRRHQTVRSQMRT